MTAFDAMRESLTAVAEELLVLAAAAEDEAVSRARAAVSESDFRGASALLTGVADRAGRADLIDRIATFS